MNDIIDTMVLFVKALTAGFTDTFKEGDSGYSDHTRLVWWAGFVVGYLATGLLAFYHVKTGGTVKFWLGGYLISPVP